jgi:hypothetical protein
MAIKFYSLRAKALLFAPFFIFLANLVIAQCSWTQYAPYISQPPVKYYTYQCGGGNQVWINSISTNKGIVNFSNLNSGCAPSTDTNNYNYFPGKLCKVNAGSKFEVVMRLGHNGINTGSYTRVAVYIDWNHNDLFEETQNYSEFVPIDSFPQPVYCGTNHVITTTIVNNDIKFSLLVPQTAKNGPTRMRIRLLATGNPSSNLLGAGGNPGACGQATYGECEDYDFEVVNPCKSPAVLSIANITCNSADICWSGVKNADLYDYWVDTCRTPGCSITPPPNPSIINYFALTDQTCVSLPNSSYPIALSQLQPEKKYYVIIRSTCDTFKKATSQYWQNSGWDIIDSFTTLPCCDAPQNIAISNITSTTASISWSPVHTSNMYEYAIATTPSIPPINATKIQGTSLVVNGLTPAKNYYFCLRALCSPTPRSSWTCVSFATLNTTHLANIAEDKIDVLISPNPFKNTVTFSSSKVHKSAQLIVTDISGRIVHTQMMKNMQKGDIDLTHLNTGLYIVKFTSEQGTSVVKIVKD